MVILKPFSILSSLLLCLCFILPAYAQDAGGGVGSACSQFNQTLIRITNSPEICGDKITSCFICSYCGDGYTLGDEVCDDGNNNESDGCRECNTPLCGDGVHNQFDIVANPGTTCDYLTDRTCRNDCTKCGDNIVNNNSEECDGTDTPQGENCREDCTLVACGDGVIDAANQETCDFGLASESDGYIQNCREEQYQCTYCGDGVTQVGVEECDGQENCRADCTLAICGDGIVDLGEECDAEINPEIESYCENNGDSGFCYFLEPTCGSDCKQQPYCGNGIKEGLEACDGNDLGEVDALGAKCNEVCQFDPYCGDGLINTAAEWCDGNDIKQMFLDLNPEAKCNIECELENDDCDRLPEDTNWGEANCCIGAVYPEEHGSVDYVNTYQYQGKNVDVFMMTSCVLGYHVKTGNHTGLHSSATTTSDAEGSISTEQFYSAGQHVLEGVRGVDIDDDGIILEIDSAWGWSSVVLSDQTGEPQTRLRPEGWDQLAEDKLVNDYLSGTAINNIGFAHSKDKGYVARHDQISGIDSAMRYYNDSNGIVTDPAKACWTCASLRIEGCFAPETLITMADGSLKAIKEINAGELVLNPVTGKSVAVKSVMESKEDLAMIAITAGGKTVKVTQTHPVYTERGVIAANQLNNSDQVSLAEGYQIIQKIEQLEVRTGQTVINIRLDQDSEELSDHMILSDGIITGDLTAQEIVNQ